MNEQSGRLRDDRNSERRSREQVGASREEAVEAVEQALAEWAEADEGGWTDAELSRARERAEAKFESEAWIRDREDPTE
jgi:lipoate-protein ligase A